MRLFKVKYLIEHKKRTDGSKRVITDQIYVTSNKNPIKVMQAISQELEKKFNNKNYEISYIDLWIKNIDVIRV